LEPGLTDPRRGGHALGRPEYGELLTGRHAQRDVSWHSGDLALAAGAGALRVRFDAVGPPLAPGGCPSSNRLSSAAGDVYRTQGHVHFQHRDSNDEKDNQHDGEGEQPGHMSPAVKRAMNDADRMVPLGAAGPLGAVRRPIVVRFWLVGDVRP
jgi:hypothetical protein